MTYRFINLVDEKQVLPNDRACSIVTDSASVNPIIKQGIL